MSSWLSSLDPFDPFNTYGYMQRRMTEMMDDLSSIFGSDWNARTANLPLEGNQSSELISKEPAGTVTPNWQQKLLSQLWKTGIKLDVAESNQNYMIKAELPGVQKENVQVRVDDDNVLHISAERKKEEIKEQGTWHLEEFSYGNVERSLRLPMNADKENIEAHMDNGILSVVLGKKESTAKTVQVA